MLCSWLEINMWKWYINIKSTVLGEIKYYKLFGLIKNNDIFLQ